MLVQKHKPGRNPAKLMAGQYLLGIPPWITVTHATQNIPSPLNSYQLSQPSDASQCPGLARTKFVFSH